MAAKPGGAAPRWAGADRKTAQPHANSFVCLQESEKAAAGAMAGLGPGAQHQAHGVSSGAAAAGDESSDSDGEHEGPQKLIRKVSTSGQIRSKVRFKGGNEAGGCKWGPGGGPQRCRSLLGWVARERPFGTAPSPWQRGQRSPSSRGPGASALKAGPLPDKAADR